MINETFMLIHVKRANKEFFETNYPLGRSIEVFR